jgi:hypothetical protein
VYSGARQSKIAFKASFWGLVFPNVIFPFLLRLL